MTVAARSEIPLGALALKDRAAADVAVDYVMYGSKLLLHEPPRIGVSGGEASECS
jgi:hypothetical protein